MLQDRRENTIIVISHQERIIDLADEIVMISGGKVARHGPKAEIMPHILADTGGMCNFLQPDRENCLAAKGGLSHGKRRHPAPAEIADLETTPGAYNIRKNGELASRNTTANIDIVSKTDKSGIDIYVKVGTKHQSVHIPVIITQTGLDELVYNDFHIGPDCDIVIVGLLRHPQRGQPGDQARRVHTFYIGENSKVQYVEKHYGEGEGTGERVMNPQTVVYLEKGASCRWRPPSCGGGLHQALHQSGGEGGRRGSDHRKTPHPRQADGGVGDGRDPGNEGASGRVISPVGGPGHLSADLLSPDDWGRHAASVMSNVTPSLWGRPRSSPSPP